MYTSPDPGVKSQLAVLQPEIRKVTKREEKCEELRSEGAVILPRHVYILPVQALENNGAR